MVAIRFLLFSIILSLLSSGFAGLSWIKGAANVPLQNFQQAASSDNETHHRALEQQNAVKNQSVNHVALQKEGNSVTLKKSVQGLSSRKISRLVSALKLLNKQFMEFNDNQILYQQSVDNRIKSLSAELAHQELQIKNLTEALSLLNTDMISLSHTSTNQQVTQDNDSPIIGLILALGLLALVIFLWWYIRWRRRRTIIRATT